MLVIVDSGSTKADWHLIDQKKVKSNFSTVGFNPFFWTTGQIFAELNKEVLHRMPTAEVSKIVFYGAGCSDVHRCMIVEKALQQVFPNAKVEVEHDLLASARACCLNTVGIACILGTGSNSCSYDGKEIIDNVTNLGHMVGDEGSGSYIGKMLIRGYFYREMPEDIKTAFEAAYPMGEKALLTEIYSVEAPNVYLASYSKFMSNHKHHPYIKGLVKEAFLEFTERHILKYDNNQNITVHFVGSVAFHFSDILSQVLGEKGLTLGKIIKKPIDRLVQYHLEEH
ncbi:MAG: hypothetical protein AB8G15_10965 [Saprospiraceae bacterium]